MIGWPGRPEVVIMSISRYGSAAGRNLDRIAGLDGLARGANGGVLPSPPPVDNQHAAGFSLGKCHTSRCEENQDKGDFMTGWED